MDSPTADGLVFENYDPELAEEMMARSHSPENKGDRGISAFLQIRTTAVGPGRLTNELLVTEDLLNPHGAAHGGVISTLVDQILSGVCYLVVPKGTWPATQEFKINFLAPGRVGPMVANAYIVSMSKRTVVARIDVTNNGRLIGVAQGTVAIMPPPPPPDDSPDSTALAKS